MTREIFFTGRQNLTETELHGECFVTVVLPVCNEAGYLLPTLKSLARQVDLQNRPLDPNLYEIIIFANNCTDNSAAIARRWRSENDSLNVHIAEACLPAESSNIGFVRRLLMNEAYLRLCRNRYKSGVIMTTDGDTRVAPDWIAANLREIKNGADAVGGRISIDFEDLRKMDAKARRFYLLDTGYRLSAAEIEARLDYLSHDYLPRHHQHFNGSFAVTTDAFRRAGGIPDVNCLEDVAFYHSLLRVDAKFRHSPFVRVKTSARRDGRTDLGLSTQINEWTVMGEKGDEYWVESARAIERRIKNRCDLRRLWRHGATADLNAALVAGNLHVSKKFLETQLFNSQTFGSLLEKVQQEQFITGEWANRYPLELITKALSDLRNLAERLRREKRALTADHSFSQTSRR
jgi:glycosyltransferase involved in cell wall biosynthesis